MSLCAGRLRAARDTTGRAAWKRGDILKVLTDAGLTLTEGTRHTIVRRDGRKISVVSRQREIPENVVREIESRTGVKLR